MFLNNAVVYCSVTVVKYCCWCRFGVQQQQQQQQRGRLLSFFSSVTGVSTKLEAGRAPGAAHLWGPRRFVHIYFLFILELMRRSAAAAAFSRAQTSNPHPSALGLEREVSLANRWRGYGGHSCSAPYLGGKLCCIDAIIYMCESWSSSEELTRSSGRRGHSCRG